MIAGHFGLAAAVKSKAPTVPLWTLMLACQWLDIVFVPLLISGTESLQPIAGAKNGAYGAAIIRADYTHSLVGALILAIVFGAFAALRYGKKTGGVLGLVVLSHWILDLVTHRADMPIFPGAAGGATRLGFGLWRYPAMSAGLELVLVVAGAALYWAAARRVAGDATALITRARLCSAAILVAGVLTLGLNVLGL